MLNVSSSGQLQSRVLLVGDLVKLELETSGYPSLGELSVSGVNDGRIRLEGCVRSYFMKQMAQTIAMHVPGVERVENDIEVIEICPPGINAAECAPAVPLEAT